MKSWKLFSKYEKAEIYVF